MGAQVNESVNKGGDGVGTEFGWFACERSVCCLGMASPAVGGREQSPKVSKAPEAKTPD